MTTTKLGNITSDFRQKYNHYARVEYESEEYEDEVINRPHRVKTFLNPVAQSYMYIDNASADSGKTVKTADMLNYRTGKQFQAILINPPSGLTIGAKRKLTFVKNLISSGILFLWSDKQDVAEWLNVFENNKFCYIENMAWVMVREDILEESN
jgi:hypothetical protein